MGIPINYSGYDIMTLKKITSPVVYIILLINSLSFAIDDSLQHTITIAETATTCGSIEIDIQNYFGEKSAWEKMVRDIIAIRPNKPCSPENIKASIENLHLCKKFKNIAVDSSFENSTRSFIFHLQPAAVIRKIKIIDEFPLFETDVLKAMTLYTGSVYSQKSLSDQVTLIEQLYKREGFIDAQVIITPRESFEKGYTDITVTINRGQPLKLKKITVSGNRAFSRRRLIRMSTGRQWLIPFRSKRFVEKKFNNNIDNLLGFYRKQKRFAECTLTPTIKIDSTQKRVTIHISLNEGPQYLVNYRYSDGSRVRLRNRQKLRKATTIFAKGNERDRELKKNIRNYEKIFKKKGYYHAQVSFRDTLIKKRTKSRRVISVQVDEEPRALVTKLLVTGNTTLNEAKIQKQILTRINKPFIQETFEQDLSSVLTLYHRYGFQYAAVSHNLVWSDSDEEVAIDIDIQEGVQSIVSSVACEGVHAIPLAKAKKTTTLKESRPFQKATMKSDAIALSILIAEQGFPFVRVKSELSFNRDSSQVDVIYRVNEGPKVHMGNIYYTGNFHTKERAIEREIGLAPGESFSLTRLLEGQKDLRDLKIFNAVSYRTFGLREQEDTVHLFVDMEEKKPFFIQAGLGYEYDLLWGKIKGGNRNLFGMNKEIRLGAGLNHLLGYDLNLRLLEPRLFRSKISAALNLFTKRIREPGLDFETTAYGSSIGISRRFLKHFSSNTRFGFEHRDQDSLSNGQSAVRTPQLINEFKPRNLFLYTAAISFNTRNSFVRPQKGVFSTFDLELSKGLASTLDDFAKFEYDLRLYVTPLKRITFATVGRVGYLIPIGRNEAVPQDQLFFLGGTGDVRGYSENKLRLSDGKADGGTASLSGSIESRIDIGLNFELAGFFDIGRLENSFLDEFRKGFLSSAGFGLRYITPIGPIGFLYGFKLNRRSGEGIGKVHFSLGYTF